MNLLYLLRNNQNLQQMQNNYHRTFYHELENQFNTTLYGPDEYKQSKIKGVPTIIDKYCDKYPDVVFITYLNKGPMNYVGLNKLDSNTVKIIHKVDNHSGRNLHDYILKQKIDLCVNVITYNGLTIKTPKTVPHWMLMHSVDHNYFTNINLKREFDFMLIGALGPSYTLRLNMLLQLGETRNKDIKAIIMPGRSPHVDYRKKYSSQINTINDRIGIKFDRPKRIFTKKQYVKYLNRTKMVGFCCGARKIPISKYLEAMACETLVLANMPKNAKEYGFINGETFVEVNERNFISKLRYYLKHPKERNRIVKNARKLIEKKHTHEIRVKQLKKQIDKIRSTKK